MNDDEFLTAFEACTLEKFHHRDHIKVACLYLSRYPLEKAVAKVRSGLQALAVAWNAPTDDLDRGYHETITQAWVRIVAVALNKYGPAVSADAFCDKVPALLDKDLLKAFYSRERLKSWTAKREYVEPDLDAFTLE